MRLISYDIGIKNLAYCIFDFSVEHGISIVEWDIISLLENTIITDQCSQMIPGKTKKLPSTKCTKIAKYHKNGGFFCEKHAKKSNFVIPTKKHTKPFLKKMKVGELEQLARFLFLFPNNEEEKKSFVKKDELIERVLKFYEKQCFEPIAQKKNEHCGEMDLIVIGKRMKKILDENPLTNTITHVIIENQISPIATRMKTIQGMLMQYYIDRNININIEFASSVNKLKQFQAPKQNVLKNTIKRESDVLMQNGAEGQTPHSSKKDSTKYREHKNSGIEYCSRIIQNNQPFMHWKEKMETKKKDDLADCFLQGLWYLKHKNIISYADDLKINIV
jgi:Mitochondrial resolvase Ydc2 / RNA splicing MRS1